MIHRNQRFLTQLYILADFAVIQFSFLIAWFIKFESGLIPYEQPLPIEVYGGWSLIYGTIAVSIGIMIGLYTTTRKKRYADDLMKILQTHVVGLFVLLSVMFFVKEINISRGYLAIYMVANVLLILCYRYYVKKVLKAVRQKGYNKQFVLILGAGTLGKTFYANLQQYPDLGYEVIGFLDDKRIWSEEEEGLYQPILGTLGDLEATLKRLMIDEVILALPLDAHHKYPRIINQCEKAGVRTLIIPDFLITCQHVPTSIILQVCR